MPPVEHYREAERLLELAANDMRINLSGTLLAAQVHATLALAGSQLRSLAAEDAG